LEAALLSRSASSPAAATASPVASGIASSSAHISQGVDTAASAAWGNIAGAANLSAVSEQALLNAKEMESPYLKHYLKALDTGLAQEIMPDPFTALGAPLAKPKNRRQSYGYSSWQRSYSSPEKDSLVDDGSSAGCKFREDIDYVGEDDGSHEGLTKKQCCLLCLKRNRRQQGACKVAVLSSQSDVPPEACWIKRDVTKAVTKVGVVSCVPLEYVKELEQMTPLAVESAHSDRGTHGSHKHGSHSHGSHTHGSYSDGSHKHGSSKGRDAEY
jgi:hypothetical protein